MAVVVERRFRGLALGCGLLAFGLSLLALIGWLAEAPLLASLRAAYIPMAPSSALCFVLVAAGLLAHLNARRWRWGVRGCALAVLAVASSVAIGHLGWQWASLDYWLVRNPQWFGQVPAGRMAPITALTFALLAAGLLELTVRRMAARAGLLGSLAALVGFGVLVGYWYGTPLLYGTATIPMAMTTACAFVLSGIGVMAAAGRRGWPLSEFLGGSTRALLLRAFVPVIVGAILLNGWLRTAVIRFEHANPAVVSALSAMGFAALVTLIISQVSRRVGDMIDRAEGARQAAQRALVLLNADLERRVAERTRELTERNQQVQDELQMARELQTALLPRSFPTVPPDVPDQQSALQFVSFYYPTGDVSGDFFNVFPIGEHAVGVLICDVMGHGVRSALITSMIRGLVEEFMSSATEPGELLTRINHALTGIFRQANTTMFATSFFVVADVGKRELRFANAGHPSPLHIHAGAAAVEKLQGDGRRGPALGLFDDVRYTTWSRPMAAGDLIMLFTDGLFEVLSASGVLFSEEKLQETVARYTSLDPEEIFHCVLAEIRQFMERETFDDDVCLIGMKVQHLPPQSLGAANL